MPTPSRKTKPGFTLIELLVVIGIIALLMAILLPVLNNARKAGKATLCMSNMRQLGLAATAYAFDYKRQLPQPGNENSFSNKEQADSLWFNAVDYYLRDQIVGGTGTADRNYDVYKQDPVYFDLPVTAANGIIWTKERVRSIKMNIFFGHDPIAGTDPTAISGPKAGKDSAFYKITDVPNPSTTLLFADGRAHDTPASSGIIDADEFAMSITYIGLRHSNQTANLSRVDGSVSAEQAPVRVTGGGYSVWYNRDTEEDEALWPDIIMNFRPKSLTPMP